MFLLDGSIDSYQVFSHSVISIYNTILRTQVLGSLSLSMGLSYLFKRDPVTSFYTEGTE